MKGGIDPSFVKLAFLLRFCNPFSLVSQQYIYIYILLSRWQDVAPGSHHQSLHLTVELVRLVFQQELDRHTYFCKSPVGF